MSEPQPVTHIITQPKVGYVDTEEKLDFLLDLVEKAQEKFSTYRQDQVDKIFKHCAIRANQYRLPLAKSAVLEANMGNVEDKVLKNHFSAETIYHAYHAMKTCGIVEQDLINGYSLYAEPVGILAGIIPCTNPTSTTIFKALIALKTRNCIVFSPHPRTVKCTIETAKLIRDAAIEAGAPEDCIGWIDMASISLCNQLMKHPKVSMIVATGAGGLIKAAYSSGKPCMGGSAGNTPVIIDETADIPLSVNSVLLSKTFDNGMICASEQAIVTIDSVAEKVKQEFIKRGGFFLKTEDKKKLADVIFKENGLLNPEAVGQSAQKLMEMAKISAIPKGSRVILTELDQIGQHEMLSREKLCPCLGFYKARTYDEALNIALCLVRFGGMGHTSVLYTDLSGKDKQTRIEKFQEMMPTGRALLCMPTSQGAIGGLYNFKQSPSMSLGCGSWGGNSSAEGLQPKHILNYKQIAERRNPPTVFVVPDYVYFGTSIIDKCIRKMLGSISSQEELTNEDLLPYNSIFDNKQKLLSSLANESSNIDTKIKHIVLLCHAYKPLSNSEFSKPTCEISEDIGTSSGKTIDLIKKVAEQESVKITILEFNKYVPDVTSDVLTLSTIIELSKKVEQINADCIISLGNTHILDAAKLIRIYIEDPTVNWDHLGVRFMNLAQRIVKFPLTGRKIKKLLCIPTTSGSGAEMSPYAIVVNDVSVVQEQTISQSTVPPTIVQCQHTTQKKTSGVITTSSTTVTTSSDISQRILTIVDQSLLPDMSVVDYILPESMPTNIAIESGCSALCNSLESYISLISTDSTKKLSASAFYTLKDNLKLSVLSGDAAARKACHRAASLGGMAAANAFLGIAEALAQQLTKIFHVPKGIGKMMVICQVIMFNAEEAPSKLALFPTYEKPKALLDYCTLIKNLEFSDTDIIEKQNKSSDQYTCDLALVQQLVSYLSKLKKDLSIPSSIQGYGIDEEKFMELVDSMALDAFDNQFTGTNPRYPLVAELTQILLDAYYGKCRTMRYDEIQPVLQKT